MGNSRLEKYYNDIAKKNIQNHFRLKNDMQVPRIKKISVNMSSRHVIVDNKIISHIYDQILAITGQRPLITKAKKSIATFKLRKNMQIGCKVTLRRTIMYEFLDRLINIALPRVRDFKGLDSNQFDGKGNFTLGLKEQIIFPEIEYNKVVKIMGMNIVFVTSTNSNKEAKFLLKTFNLPFYN
jgi:large subunit ribosomal protein L5